MWVALVYVILRYGRKKYSRGWYGGKLRKYNINCGFTNELWQ